MDDAVNPHIPIHDPKENDVLSLSAGPYIFPHVRAKRVNLWFASNHHGRCSKLSHERRGPARIVAGDINRNLRQIAIDETRKFDPQLLFAGLGQRSILRF